MGVQRDQTIKFLQNIIEALNRGSADQFITEFPRIIQQFFPLKSIIVYYKESPGDRFTPHSDNPDLQSLPVLSGSSKMISAFAEKKESLHLIKSDRFYLDLFDTDTEGALTAGDYNLIIPLHSRYHYHGILLGALTKQNVKRKDEICRAIMLAANMIVPLIESKNIELENDRNYYKLFKFDRLVLLGEMVAAIAHELRTPLNTILLELSELDEFMETSVETSSALKKVDKEIHRISGFIQSLLSFSKFQKIQLEQVSLSSYIESLLKDIPAKKIPARLKIKTDLDPGITLTTDKNRLRQVLFNILFNAFDAVDTNGIITINTCRSNKGHRKYKDVIVSVSDNGPGIPQDIKDRILEPFFTTKADGTGLGLYITYGIVKSLKGNVEIQSTVAGTTVLITLPGE